MNKERIIELGYTIVATRADVQRAEAFANEQRAHLTELETELDGLLGNADDNSKDVSCDTMTVSASTKTDWEPWVKLLKNMLTRGSVLLRLDATRADVRVAAQHKHDTGLILRIGYDLEPSIPDLHVDERGISGTLEFKGEPHECFVPWEAVRQADLEGEMWKTPSLTGVKKRPELKLVPMCSTCNDEPGYACDDCETGNNDGPSAA